MKLDLAITNGFVVDGTGLPRRRADVGVRGGRIAVVGHVDAADARRVIDAEGRVVAPGIVDAHTHYDPQLTFDPFATSSCFHGVTTVVAGNCGFSIAPTRADDRDFITQMFARVEGMSPRALAGVRWDFETFPEFLGALEGNLGVNAACYVGHSAVRRWVMGDAAFEREASAAEVEAMRELVAGAMAAGAAGFSSTHSPTHWDSFDRPVPSRLSSQGELEALVAEAGRAHGGSIAYLPFGVIRGLDRDDQELLMRLALASRLPVIIQGLGARSKVDAPTAAWEEARAFVAEADTRGAGIFSMVMSRPMDRSFTLAEGTSLYEGVLPFHRLFTEAKSVEPRMAKLRDPAFRDAIRHAVESPNTDPKKGPTLPPPGFAQLQVHHVRAPGNEKYVDRTLAEIAAEKRVAPMDAMLEIALADRLETEFVWRTESPQWRERTFVASSDPHMVLGTSDGGAHLDRDDGAQWSSYFLRYWVREWGKWSLEEGIRRITQQPAALLGFSDRGMLLPHFAADLWIFDPERVGPGRKEFVHDFPNGEGRWKSWPEGVFATIVNGVPVVLDGEIVPDCGRPGQVLRPGRAFERT